MVVKFLLNAYSIVKTFFRNHWEWIFIMLVSISGLVVTYMAYRHAKRSEKEATRERLFNAALEDFRSKGEPTKYLLGKWDNFKNKGWTKEEFEKIYYEVYRLHKGKEPKNSLFES